MDKKIFLEKLGRNISRIREEQGLSQSQLASMCLKDRQSLNRLEKGKINPSVFYLLELSLELKVDLKDFFDFK
jgi:transcriptional regulator with XRE-family HTH domain